MLRIIAALCVLATSVSAQSLDVPFSSPSGPLEVNGCTIHYVAGLDPNGDGFLTVRAGPSSSYRKIDEIHNADAVYPCARSGPWMGIVYTGSSHQNGHRDQHPRRKGWVHSNWVINGAG